MSTVTKYPLKLKTLLISNISDISLPRSPMNLFLHMESVDMILNMEEFISVSS